VTILVTVGHQLPFDRLVRTVDAWAERTGRRDVFAQVGHTSYRPRNCQAVEMLTPADLQRRIQEATGIVAHAGIGTIAAALEAKRPLLVLPRLVRFNEVRSDHQIPTAKHFEGKGYLLAAYDEEELMKKLDVLESFRPTKDIPDRASPELIERLRRFIFTT
jgi:UDP-N-acetylglucosamine transferase subunit ALG13